MKIKRLEILGFKSFVDRVILDFQQPVTGVVGPNGCGKSNIVDAIRWGMGEQSAKNLRGKAMEDIIFAGSESRKAHGMAEVSLVFSADDGKVPSKYLNFSEIQVTRRLYRDGESEYYLNKTPCRLMDITELFMDTGVGARAYSIIEQGKIGFILHSKPEERRFLIEEAAGVTKYKTRKQLALKKIDATRQNLVRLSDVVNEIKRQLNSLQRQAKKAEKFRQLREELREIELFFIARELKETIAGRDALAVRLKELQEREQVLAAESARVELDLEERKVTLLEEERTVSVAQEELFAFRSELQAAENRAEFRRRELETLLRQKERLEEETARIETQLAEARKEKEVLAASEEQFGGELTAEAEQLVEAEQLLETLTTSDLDVTRRLEETRRELFRLLSEIAQIHNAESAAAKRLQGMSERYDRQSREVMLLQERTVEVGRANEKLEAARKTLREEKEQLSEALAVAVRREEELRRSAHSGEQDLQKLRSDFSAARARLKSLKELEASLAGYGQGVRTILLDDAARRPFNGMVADMLEVPEQYEAAVEAALGERLQYLVTDKADNALAALGFLRMKRGGKGGIVFDAPSREVAQVDGAIPLDSIVRVTATPELVQPLLHNVFLVPAAADGVRLAVLHPEAVFVTAEGDLFSHGVAYGGSGDNTASGIIHKKREIRDLSARVVQAEEELQRREAEHARLKQQLAETTDEIRHLRQELHQVELRVVNTEKDLQRGMEEYRRIAERLAVTEQEQEQLLEEKGGLEKELQQSGVGKEEREREKTVLEERSVALQRESEEVRRQMAASRERVTAMKVRAASLRERKESVLRNRQRVEQLATELSGRLESHRRDLVLGEEERQRLAAEASTGEEQLKVLVRRAAEGEERLSLLRQKLDAVTEAVRVAESSVREKRAELEQIRKRSGDDTLSLAEIDLRLRHVEGNVREKYRLEPEAVVGVYGGDDGSDEERSQRREELRKGIEDIGEVNLTAIDEFRQLEERFLFLNGQKEDLEESLHALQQAIQKINRTTRKRFYETFHQVNAKFQEIFPRLFCGGYAELKLTNEEDLLETGIDIVVRPPGKKLQNVSLLSGGEKALTALALIFSIFLIKPTPFCLLDEVDAPLDDANIGRFNDMVREMSVISQFIMITHNKSTMTVADTLYGITMEEPGVSKLVSVKLNEGAGSAI